MSSDNVCALRHAQQMKRDDAQDKKLEEHDIRLDALEKGQIKTDTLVGAVCKKVDLLINVLLGCTGTLVVVLLSFLIWYIQQQPK